MSHWLICEPMSNERPCLYEERRALRHLKSDPPRCIKHGALLFSQSYYNGWAREDVRRDMLKSREISRSAS
jgi:hypothetical protein